MAAVGGLGGLVVTLGLDAAEFVQGLTKAQYETKKTLDNIKSTATKIAGALGVGLSISAFEGMIKGALEAEVRLKELGLRAGLSGAQMSSFMRAARLSGTDLETVANMSAKLSKTLLESQDAGSKAGAVLKALGFTSTQLAGFLQDPAQGMFEIAKALNELPEGGTKAAASLFLLGRGGAQVSAFFEELSKQTQLVQVRTNEEIIAAKELMDKFSDMEARTSKLKTTLANALVPVLDDVLTAFTNVTTAGGGMQKTLSDLSNSGSIAEWGRDTATVMATVADSVLYVTKTFRALFGSLQVVVEDVRATKTAIAYGIGKASNDELEKAVERRNKILEDANKRYADLFNPDVSATPFTSALEKQFAKGREGMGGGQGKLFSDRAWSAAEEQRKKEAADKEKRLRSLVEEAGRGGPEKMAQQLLRQQLKAQEEVIKDEQDLLRDREAFLQTYYNDDLISVRDYFAARQAAYDEAQTKTVAAYDAMIAAEKAFISNPATKPEAKVEAETRIAEATAKRSRVLQDSAIRNINATIDEQRALDRYLDSVKEVTAAVLEMSGREREAAEIRFRQQYKQQRARATVEGDQATLDAIDALEKQKLAQTDMTVAAQKYSVIQSDIAVAEGRVQLAQQQGAITTLEAMSKRGDIARQYADLLTKQADAQEAAARAMLPGAEQAAALANVARLRLEIDQLKESANELENTFRAVFVDSFGNALADVIDGTKSLSDAFKSMEKQIVASISRIAANNIAEAIFGKGTAGGGSISMLAGLFGGSGKWLSSLLGGGAAPGGGWVSGEMLGGLAGGGPVQGRTPYVVGERGPELFVPRNAGTIIPNDVLTARRAERTNNISINVNVAGGASSATADQIAVRTGLAVRRAIARNA